MRTTPLLGAALAAVLALGACAADDGAAPVPRGDDATLLVVGQDNLHWSEDSYEVRAGEINVVLTNAGSVPHTLLITDDQGQDMGIRLSVGRRDEGTVTLEPGSYVIWCDVPGHLQAGMEAPLTVTE
jgi:plastocyanin